MNAQQNDRLFHSMFGELEDVEKKVEIDGKMYEIQGRETPTNKEILALSDDDFEIYAIKEEELMLKRSVCDAATRQCGNCDTCNKDMNNG